MAIPLRKLHARLENSVSGPLSGMIVTIDGPAGAGKSTVSRRLAERLGFEFLDTGAMYRAVALLGLRRNVDWNQPDQLTKLAETARISFEGTCVTLNGEDVSDEIRTLRVTKVTRFAAGNDGVRRQLVEWQRCLAAGKNIVTEGRDQGTLVFPEAGCKIYLDATPQERARRRVEDLKSRGESADFQDILAQQTQRDEEDQKREFGGLYKAEDAIEVLTDGLSQEEVLEKLVEIVQRCQDA